MADWRSVNFVIVLLTILIPVHYCGVCGDAGQCIKDIQSISSSTSCLADLETFSDLKKCIEDNIDDCGIGTKITIQTTLDAVIDTFTESCSDGCINFIEKVSSYTKCVLSDDDLETVLTSAVTDWNSHRSNENIANQVRKMVTCIEAAVVDCTPLRKRYGQLYQTFPQLPLIQQTLQNYKEVNGADPSSPIISDCDKDWKVVLKEIISSCPLQTRDKDWLIVNYCVPMQEQIDCALRWQNTCPVAVTKFLRPFMDSYGITHTIFCNNITIHGVMLQSLNRDCQSDNYQKIYKECWQTIMKEFALSQNTNNDQIDGYSMDMLFRLASFEGSKLCQIFKDRSRSNIQQMRTCTRKWKKECPLIFPTHGSPPTLPDGLQYDPDLYKQILAGATPFNEYGVVLLQYLREHICYPDCADYDKLNVDYKEDCKAKLQEKVQEISENKTEQCESLSQKITCASNVTIRCPLFQYQTTRLFDEADIKVALKICNLTEPELLPDDYIVTTTTSKQQPVRTTTYWIGSTTRYTGPSGTTAIGGGVSNGGSYISSHLQVVALLLGASLLYMYSV